MLKLKKSLGQHFLKNEEIIQKIIRSLEKYPCKNLLEVGPGGGALTRHLIQMEGIDFKAVELDDDKVAYLLKTFPGLKGNLFNESFLDMQKPFDEPFHIVGNFPYNISSQILFKIIEWEESVPVVTGMFQKEVAQRAAAREGNKTYGVLSVLVQYYYDVEYLFSVGKESFNPPPKVESGVIRLVRRDSRYPVKSEKAFRMLVKTAFSQRRKTLRNCLKGVLDKETLADPLFDRRAETLHVKEFADLTFKLS